MRLLLPMKNLLEQTDGGISMIKTWVESQRDNAQTQKFSVPQGQHALNIQEFPQ